MLIFDGFPTPEQAHQFAEDVTHRFRLEATVYDNADDAFAADPFPFELTAPVVHVERTEDDREFDVQAFVAEFGGHFAGT